jgi:hypothetical protein
MLALMSLSHGGRPCPLLFSPGHVDAYPLLLPPSCCLRRANDTPMGPANFDFQAVRDLRQLWRERDELERSRGSLHTPLRRPSP